MRLGASIGEYAARGHHPPWTQMHVVGNHQIAGKNFFIYLAHWIFTEAHRILTAAFKLLVEV